MNEAQIQRDIRLALGKIPGLVMYRNSVGYTGHDLACKQCGFTQPGEDGPRIKFGLCKGSSDLVGILAPAGRWICLEVKTEKGRVTPEQDMFMELIKARGGFATVVRSVEDALAAVERCRVGESQ